MKRIGIISLVILIFVTSVCPLGAAWIFHTDGSIIEGKIVRQTATRVTVKLPDGKKRTIEGRDIMRIRERDTVRKDVYVLNTADGSLFVTNIVDETAKRLIARASLFSPEETSYEKDTFIAAQSRRSCAIEGIAGANDLSLEWAASPEDKSYMIFTAAENGAFTLAGKSERAQFVLKNLKGNSPYDVMIGVIDSKGKFHVSDEAARFMTGNKRPAAPENLRCVRNSKGGFDLTWDTSSDDDGSIAEYRVYSVKGASRTVIGSPVDAAFTFPETVEDGALNLRVSAVDDRGTESLLSEPVVSRETRVADFGVRPFYMYPVRSLRDYYAYGCGAFFNAGRENIFTRGTYFGFALGGAHLAGKSDRKADLFAALLEAGYGKRVRGPFALSATLSAGAGYYSGKTYGSSFQRYVPVGMVSISPEYHAGSGSVSLSAGCAAFSDRRKLRVSPVVSLGVSVSIER